MTEPPVSVVIPTLNRPLLLTRAVRAVLGQDYDGLVECVVVLDQGALAPAPLITRRWPPQRSLRFVSNARQAGLAGARNHGLAVSCHDLLALCDDDDVWHPGKLREQVPIMLANDGVGLVTCLIRVLRGHKVFTRASAATQLTAHDLRRSARFAETHPSSWLMRRATYRDVGPFDEDIPFGCGDDYDWLLRASLKTRISVVRQALVDVNWQRESHFSGRWDVVYTANRYLLRKHPELAVDRAGASRIYGKIAIAAAATQRRRESMQWSWRCLRRNWREPRGVLALAIASGVVRANWVLAQANARGHGL